MSAEPKSVWQADGSAFRFTLVATRLDMLRSFDADKCRQALAEGNIQKTVQSALVHRLRKLERRLRRLEAGK